MVAVERDGKAVDESPSAGVARLSGGRIKEVSNSGAGKSPFVTSTGPAGAGAACGSGEGVGAEGSELRVSSGGSGAGIDGELISAAPDGAAATGSAGEAEEGVIGALSALVRMGPVMAPPVGSGGGGARCLPASVELRRTIRPALVPGRERVSAGAAWGGGVPGKTIGPSARVAGLIAVVAASSGGTPELPFAGLRDAADCGDSCRFLALKNMSGHRMVFKLGAPF